MASRADILHRYITVTEGKPVGDDQHWGGPQAPALANDWLQYLTGRPDLYVPGHAIQWATAVDADGVPTGDRLNAAIEVLDSIARFYPARPHRRAVAVPPQPGDLIVFSNIAGFPGTLGLYLNHDDEFWDVYTQGIIDGYLPASRFQLPVPNNKPLGWWRVDERNIHAAHGYDYSWTTA